MEYFMKFGLEIEAQFNLRAQQCPFSLASKKTIAVVIHYHQQVFCNEWCCKIRKVVCFPTSHLQQTMFYLFSMLSSWFQWRVAQCIRFDISVAIKIASRFILEFVGYVL